MSSDGQVKLLISVCNRLSLAYCCDGTIAFATETKRSATHIGRNGTHCHQHITYAYPNIHKIPHVQVKTAPFKKTKLRKFKAQRELWISTSPFWGTLLWQRRHLETSRIFSVTTCPCIADESKEFAGLLSKPLKSQSPPRMLQTCQQTSETTSGKISETDLWTEQFVM